MNIVYDTKKEFFYIKEIAMSFDFWLSVESFKEKPEENLGLKTPAYLCIDGKWKKVKPFSYFSLEKLEPEEIDDEDLKVIDYRKFKKKRDDRI